MKFYFTIILPILFLYHSFGQNITEANRMLFDSVENVYLSPCIDYAEKKIPKKDIRKDRRVIKLLNRVSVMQLSEKFEDQLISLRFKPTAPEIRIDHEGRTIHNYVKDLGGNVKGFVQVAEKSKVVHYQRILLSTDSKFYCDLPNKSFNQFYVDFIYLKKFLRDIKFPLTVASSNTELQSQRTYF